MKAATVHEIGKELKEISPARVRELCVRLAKFKKENKELLTYLLFEANDEDAYVEQAKLEMETEFATIPNPNIYYLKKSLRRILRTVNKQIRYSGQNTTEIELRIHFCLQMKSFGIPVDKNTVLQNIYQQQLKKIRSILGKLEEDLQLDYQPRIKKIS